MGKCYSVHREWKGEGISLASKMTTEEKNVLISLSHFTLYEKPYAVVLFGLAGRLLLGVCFLSGSSKGRIFVV